MHPTIEAMTRSVRIEAGTTQLEGDLVMPDGATGVILFAHGSGSSRFSPRNRRVAAALQERRFATLLLDLLTPQEETIDERTAHLRFDVELLGGRLVHAVDWLGQRPETARLPVGTFGASTGAAAALIAAAEQPAAVGAVVSRGGRPDLACAWLPRVEAPTLLLVGERDVRVLELNRRAFDVLRCEKRLEIVPGASHLFEEPGALELVAERAGAWFEEKLTRTSRA